MQGGETSSGRAVAARDAPHRRDGARQRIDQVLNNKKAEDVPGPLEGHFDLASTCGAFVIRAEPDQIRGRKTSTARFFDFAIAQKLAKGPEAFLAVELILLE